MACPKENSLVTHSYINRVIKSMEIQKYKKQKILDRNDQQNRYLRQRFTANNEIENEFWTMRVILPKLIPLSNGNDNFYSDNIDFATDNVKFRRKHKYEKKLLVWMVMSPRGISEPFIMASGNAVDQFDYRYKIV